MTMLRKMLTPKEGELTGWWRRLHKEEIYGLYSLPNIIRVIKSRTMRLAGHVARMEDRKDSYRVLVRRPEGKKPIARSRFRWKNNIKKDLKTWDGEA